MSVVPFPDITPNSASWGLVSNTSASRSELNGAVQTLALPGDIWKGTLTFTNKTGVEANQLKAFFVGLRGRAGRFTMSPPGYQMPQSGESGDVVVVASNAGQVITTALPTADNTTITVDSTLTADSTHYELLPGDYIEILGELKMVTSSAYNGLLREVTISFVPPMRQPVPIGTVVITDRPKCTMMLDGDDQAQWQHQPGKIYAMTVAVMEAISI